MKKSVLIMWNFQTFCGLKLNSKKVDQYSWNKQLIKV